MTLLSIIPFLNFYVSERLLRVIYRTALTNHINFNLTRIFQFSFDLFGDISCQQNHICICNLFRYYHYTNFPACLNSKGLVDSLKFICNVFQLFQTVCVSLKCLSSCTRPCC